MSGYRKQRPFKCTVSMELASSYCIYSDMFEECLRSSCIICLFILYIYMLLISNMIKIDFTFMHMTIDPSVWSSC